MQPESKVVDPGLPLSSSGRALRLRQNTESSECEEDDEEPSQVYCTPAAAAMKGDPEELRAFWELSQIWLQVRKVDWSSFTRAFS